MEKVFVLYFGKLLNVNKTFFFCLLILLSMGVFAVNNRFVLTREIYYNTYRVQGKPEADAVIAQVGRYPIELVDADQALTLEAARLKGKYRIAYADCFAAALAGMLNGKVVTGDREFKNLEKEIDIEWII